MPGPNENQILVNLEAKALAGALADGLKQLQGFITLGANAEKVVAGIGQQLQTLSGPNVLRQISLLGKALSGAFDLPGLRLQALQGQLKALQSETVNMIASIANAQARAGARLGTAVNEQRVQNFTGPGTNTLAQIRRDNDLASLQARAEAERRAQNATLLQGGTVGAQSTTRLETIQKKIDQINDAEKAAATQRRADATVQGQLVQNQVKGLTAISALETLSLQIKKEQLVLDRARIAANGQITAEVQKQAAVVAGLKTQYANLKTQEDAAKSRAKALNPTLTPEESAQRTNENIRSRFSLNGGADVFRLQAQILANYKLVTTAIQTIQGGARFVVEFEQSLAQLQAITGATTGEVALLSKTFLELSTTTRFSGDEIAKAAVIMGQAGLSANQIKDTISAVVKLATATGTDLKVAVDLTTSIMGAFNIRVGEMANVTNLVTAALNQSKLDAEKLALGIQFAGNVAATAGISFLDMTTALAAMSNQGVKSGSTLGTGLRQLINDLVNPSEKLTATFNRLGLTVGELDIKSQGIFGVLKNLREAGFTVADAMQTMELRGAAAFANLFKQLDGLDDMKTALAEGGDAAAANAIQMNTAESAMKRLGSAAGALAANSSGPLLTAFKSIVNGLADLVGWLAKAGDWFAIATTAVGAFATIITTKWLGGLLLGLTGLKNLAAGLGAYITLVGSATTVTEGFVAATTLLTRSNVILLALTAAATAVFFAWDKMMGKTEQTAAELDRLNTSLNASKGRFEEARTAYESVAEQIDNLNKRYTRLSENSGELKAAVAEMNSKFKDLGFYVSESTTSVDGLIKKLRELSDEKLRAQRIELGIQEGTLREKARLQEKEAAGLFGSKGSAAKVPGIQDLGFGVVKGGRVLPEGAGRSEDRVVARGILTGPHGDQILTLARRAVEAAKGVDLSDPGKIEEKLTELGEIVRDINKEDESLSQEVDGNVEASAKRLSKIRDFIATRTKALTDLKITRKSVDSTRRQGEIVEAAGSDITHQLDQLRQDALRAQDHLLAELKNSVRAGGDRDQAKRIYNKGITDLALTMEDTYKSLLSTLSEEELAAFKKAGGTENFDKVRAEFRKHVDDANLDIHKLDAPYLEELKKDLQSKIAAAQAKINSKTASGDIKLLEPELDGLYDSLLKAELAIVANKRKQLELQNKTSTEVATDKEITERINTQRGEAILKVHQNLESFNESIAELNHKIDEGFQRPIKEIGTTFTTIGKRLKLAADDAKSLIEEQNTKIEAARFRFNGNANTISDVQLQKEKEKLETLTIESERLKLNSLENAVAQYKTLQDQTTDVIQRAKARASAVREELNGPNADNLSREDADKLKAEALVLDRQILDLGKQQLNTNEQLAAVDQERLQLKQLLAIQTAPQQPDSIGMSFTDALTQYRREAGLTKSFNVQLVDSFKGGFGSINTAMGAFVANSTNGAQTIGRAFKNMGVSILKSMQELASQLAAKGLLELLFKVGLKFFGGSNDTVTTGGATQETITSQDMDYQNRAAGGMIRAASGRYVMGPITTRDSVPTLTMPGEYITRASVVSAVGRPFMDRLNSMGPRALDMQVPMVGANNNKPGLETVNVWVVSQDQVPPPGPRDIVAHVAADMAKGGITRKLVKSIAAGQE